MRGQLSILAIALALAACGKGGDGSEPSGQVVATVDGQEITSSELKLELQGAPKDPAAAAQMQQAALQNLINRKLLVAAAKDRDLDSSPLAAMMKARAEDMAMIQLLQTSLAGGVPKISDDEVREYMSSNPTTFSQRKLISVDQLLVPKVDQTFLKEVEPLNTLPEIEELLKRRKFEYVKSGSVLDTVSLPPEVAQKIGGMASGEVFVSPNQGGVAISRIVSSRDEPLAGAEGEKAARVILTRQRNGTQVRQSLEEIIKSGQSKVKINPEFAPKKPAAGAPAPKN